MSKQQVAEEVAIALNTFMAEGFCESVGFKAEDSGESAVAEVYTANGEIASTYKITFTVEETSN
jgi:hypothetical protein